MPKLIMKARLSGTRNGKHWPKPGETVEVSDREAKALIRNGLVVDPDTVEDDEPEPKKTAAKKASAKKASGSA